MVKKTLLSIVFFLVLLKPAYAEFKDPGDFNGRLFDNRKLVLAKFLAGYQSPLAKNSADFIDYGQKYQIDWKLLVAIAGMESTFGRNIPRDSFNPFGFDNGLAKFENFSEAIETTSKTLKEHYFDAGVKDISSIARVYCPPNSRKWAAGVEYFLGKLEAASLKPSFSLVL
ncbi:MAG: hypothetical protein Q8N98_02550 [bacterium]|nr:hypothetical protein [bacterium]